MNINPKKWIKTLPKSDSLHNNKLVIETNKIAEKEFKIDTDNSIKKYSFAITIFIIGLVFVSVIKNQTRNLQKEIDGLEASINNIKFDLHQQILEHEVITSPKNLSQLAKEYLEPEFLSYEKNQVKKLEEGKIISNVTEKDLSSNKKSIIAKQIEQTRIELKKLQELYSNPQKIPDELKNKVSKKIEETQNELARLYSSPKDPESVSRIQKWAGIQIIKAFLGMPVVPGK